MRVIQHYFHKNSLNLEKKTKLNIFSSLFAKNSIKNVNSNSLCVCCVKWFCVFDRVCVCVCVWVCVWGWVCGCVCVFDSCGCECVCVTMSFSHVGSLARIKVFTFLSLQLCGNTILMLNMFLAIYSFVRPIKTSVPRLSLSLW